MIDKAKRDRLIFAIIGGVAFAASVITAIIVILQVLDSKMPFVLLAISAVCFYLTPFMGFLAADRNSAVKLLGFIESTGSRDAGILGEKMGWKSSAVEKMLLLCEKWGYIEKN